MAPRLFANTDATYADVGAALAIAPEEVLTYGPEASTGGTRVLLAGDRVRHVATPFREFHRWIADSGTSPVAAREKPKRQKRTAARK